MSHSTVLVILHNREVESDGLEAALEAALEPFDENRETPRYIKHTKAQAIALQREELIRYRDHGLYAEYAKDPAAYAESSRNHPEHLEYLSTGFPEKLTHLDDEEWLYQEATKWEELDEDGNITSAYNPKSKWDWWTIGGRWSDSVLNAEGVVHHPEEVRSSNWTTPAWDEHTGGVDYLQKKDLTSCRGTFAVLDAAGEWHEKGRMGWFGMVADEAEPDEWDAKHKELVAAAVDDDWLVVVDVHI